jgi:transcriptional regulator with XRE-family HTH domain
MTRRKRTSSKLTDSLLRRARLRRALTQQEVADRVGVTQPMISLWEQGKADPTEEQFDALEEHLGPLTESEDDDGGDEYAGSAGPFGAWLKRARETKKFSVPQLATKAGVTPAAIYNLESGRSGNPQEATRKALESALGKVPDEVVEEAKREQEVEGIGALTDFEPHSSESALPTCGGVYVLYDLTGRPTYVGQGQMIKKRIVDHRQKFWFKSPVVETAAYIKVEDPKLRLQFEQILIRFLKNHLLVNKQGVHR